MRFDFEGEWVQSKIGEIISVKSDKYNPETDELEYPCIELECLSQGTGELLSTFNSKSQKSIKNVFRSGDVLFGKLRPYLRKYYLADFEGVCSSEIWVMRSAILSPAYLYAFVQSNIFQELTEISSGTRMPRADWNLISESVISYPFEINEKEKIGELFRVINARIQTQNKIIEGLRASKTVLSKKVFMQELRFSEFSDGWEKKELGEIGEIVNGLTYSPNDIDENGVLVLRSSNIQNRELIFDDNVFVNTSSFNAVLENDILICVRNGSKNLIGKNAIIKKEHEGFAFGAFMAVYRSRYNKFLSHWFDTEEYKEEVRKNLGATINSINGSNLKKFKVPFPKEVEQQKIANFLSAYDQKIETETAILNLLTNQKQYLLANLFV